MMKRLFRRRAALPQLIAAAMRRTNSRAGVGIIGRVEAVEAGHHVPDAARLGRAAGQSQENAVAKGT